MAKRQAKPVRPVPSAPRPVAPIVLPPEAELPLVRFVRRGLKGDSAEDARVAHFGRRVLSHDGMLYEYAGDESGVRIYRNDTPVRGGGVAS